MRILGLDFGSKTIGIAVSDPFGWTAQGVEIIRREQEEALKKSLMRIEELIKQYQVTKIVMGLPKNMNGTIGERGEKTIAFAEKLKSRFPNVETILWDERLTTVAAEKMLITADVSRQKRKKVIDQIAATFILQGYLDSQSSNK